MKNFTLLVICCVMLNDFIVRLLGLPSALHFLPEILSVIVIVYVLLAGMRDRFRWVAPKYWIVFSALAVVMICGIINNPSGAGPLLSSMRFYLRAVPLFFLPAVLNLNEEDFKRQLKWLLALALLQMPLAVYQRWNVMSEGRFSGDDVKGSLMDSGILSMYLICVVSILTGLLIRGRLGKLWYLVLIFLVLVPTAIDETKASIILLPLAMLVTLFFASDRGKRLRNAGMGIVALAVFAAMFIPVYNMMEEHNPFKNEKDITAYFTNEKLLASYLSSDVGGVGTKKDVRRGDAISVPLNFIAREPVRLAFGLGLGNVAPSNLGKNFEGSYFPIFQQFLITSFTFFMLDLGIFGLFLIGLLFWMNFSDAFAVARRDATLFGAIAAGWTGGIAVFAVCTVYTIYFEFTSVTYLYWYFAGVMSVRRLALAHEVQPTPYAAARPRLDLHRT